MLRNAEASQDRGGALIAVVMLIATDSPSGKSAGDFKDNFYLASRIYGVVADFPPTCPFRALVATYGRSA